MEHEQFEDSIDDLISMLNHNKSKGPVTFGPGATRENKTPTYDDIAEIGGLLNSPFGRFQKKAEQSTQNLTGQTSTQLMNRVLNTTVRPLDNKLQSKGDMISRNFLSKTTGHPPSKEDENKQREERNLTTYFKLAKYSFCLFFIP